MQTNHDEQAEPKRNPSTVDGDKVESSSKASRKRSSTYSCSSPTTLDVLCGRGKSYDQSPGNIEFRRITKEFATEYFATSRIRKQGVLQKIAQLFKGKGMRFIKKQQPDNETWTELDAEAIKQKIGHALRDATTEGKAAKTSRLQSRQAQRRTSASSSVSSMSITSHQSSTGEGTTTRESMYDPLLVGRTSHIFGGNQHPPQGNLVSALLDEIRRSKQTLMAQESASAAGSNAKANRSIASLPVNEEQLMSRSEGSILGSAAEDHVQNVRLVACAAKLPREGSTIATTSTTPGAGVANTSIYASDDMVSEDIVSGLSPATANSGDDSSPISPGRIASLFDEFKADSS